MLKAQSFQVNARLEDLSIERESNTWKFRFTNDVYLAVDCMWRLLDNGCIVAVSADEGEQFGFDMPTDLASIVQSELKNAILQLVDVREGTGDMVLTFSNNKQIEVLITSVGYENYDFHCKGKRYIAGGNGLAEITS